MFVFISDNYIKITTDEIVLIYKNRWQIEILLKNLNKIFN